MATLKHIGPGSALKLGAITYAFVGLVIGVIAACLSLIAGSLAGMGGSDTSMTRAFGFGMGVWAIIVFPIGYAIVGGIGAWIGAAVYNLAARWVGGLEVDIS